MDIPDIGFKAFTGLHRRIFDLTDGRFAGKLAGMPVVKISTIGRKTGKQRHTMLSSPVHSADRVVLVASKGGAPRHPAWYLNLRDQPQVTITMLGTVRTMVARTATEAEKTELWPQIVATYQGYGNYQKRTDRDIPVVILEPAT